MELNQHCGRDMGQGPAAGGRESVFEAATEKTPQPPTHTDREVPEESGAGQGVGCRDIRAQGPEEEDHRQALWCRTAAGQGSLPGHRQASCPLGDSKHKATWAPAVPSPTGPVPQELNMADRAGCWQQGLSTVSDMTSDE